MSSEGYRLEHQEFRGHPEKVLSSELEPILPLSRSGESNSLSFVSRRRARKQPDYASFNTQNESGGFIGKTGKTLQVATLATAELLASATAVVAGGVVAGGALHFPFTAYTLLAMNIPIFPGIIVPVTLSVLGVGLIAVGMKRIGAATKRVRSLF